MSAMRDNPAVAAEPAPEGCIWRVTRAEIVAMSGQAPNPEAAHRLSAFAASALEALERVGRRRF